MNRLRGLARADRDYLREVELKAGRVTEHLADRAEDGGIHHELAGFRRARDKAAGAARALAAEIVGAERGGVGEGTQLVRRLRP